MPSAILSPYSSASIAEDYLSGLILVNQAKNLEIKQALIAEAEGIAE